MSQRKTKLMCIKHAARRAMERHGIVLTFEQCNQISNFIKNKDRSRALYIDKRSNRITRWKVFYNNKWIPVAYDKIRGTVVSILPEGSLDDNYVECKQCPWTGHDENLKMGNCPECGTFLGDIVDHVDQDID